MISADSIRTIAANKSIHPGVIEKDYVLSKTLMAFSGIKQFRELLVFKGGTALKKCYFSDWRYSEDLDFTARYKLLPSQLQTIFQSGVENVSSSFGLPLRISEFSQYPKNSEDLVSAQLKLTYDGPLHQSSGQKNNIRVDIAFFEEISLPSTDRKIIEEYSDDLSSSVPVYALEEIVAEKLRSILQRGKSRDYYDVWVLLKNKQNAFDKQMVRSLLATKCRDKEIPHPTQENFFGEEQLAETKRFWERGLAHQISDLPPFESVISELRDLILDLLS